MDLQLDKKVALVCASSAGIGKGIAKSLVQEGAHVSIFSRNAETVELARKEIEAVAKGKVIASAGDLTRDEDIDRILSDTRTRLGPIDILINNQGGPAPGGLDEVTDEQLFEAYQLNLRAVFRLAKLCVPSMRQRGWGRIIHVLSSSAKEPLPNMVLSNIYRPAVLGLSKSLANEYARDGITVNSLLPSGVLTDRAVSLIERRASREKLTYEAALELSSNAIPVGHIATVEEFAQMAVFLCSPKASYLTGVAIAVDGGFTKGLF